MTEIRLRHEIECDEETFFEKCVLNEEYNRRLFVDRLKFPRYNILEQADLGGTFKKRVEMDPPVTGIPGPVKKVIGDRFSYVEEGVYDRAKKRYTFKIIPSTMADKTKVDGVLYTEKLPGNRCVRVVEINVAVKVFAVGGMVEERIAGDLRTSYEASAGFTNEFVKEKGY